MYTASAPGNLSFASEFVTWLLTFMLVAAGLRLAGKLVLLMLDKLYEFFVLKNPTL